MITRDLENWLKDPAELSTTQQLDRTFRYAVIRWIRRSESEDRDVIEDALALAIGVPDLPYLWRGRWTLLMDIMRDAGRQP